MMRLALLLIFLTAAAQAADDYKSLGKVYYLPDGGNQLTLSKAVYVNNLKASANAGDMRAVYTLGLVFQQEDNFKDAFQLFAKACDTGKVKEACNNAGFIRHHNLDGRKKNEIAQALPYYVKARDAGDSFAIFNLGRYYFLTKNYMMAYLHYDLAQQRLKNRTDQQRSLNSKTAALKKMSELEKKYDAKYYPSFLAHLNTRANIGKRDTSKTFPLPPEGGIIKERASLTTRIGADTPKKKAIMLDWKPSNSTFIELTAPLITDDVSDIGVMSHLIYRYDIPVRIKMSLTEKTTVLPIILGDEVMVHIYSGAATFQEGQWEIEGTDPMTSLGTEWHQRVNRGWEVFTLKPMIKGNIRVRFENKQTKEKLSLILWVQ